MMQKTVVIEALAAGFRPCGLREFAYQICSRLAAKSHPGLRLVFIVPPGMSGCFGPAEYIEAGSVKVKVMRRIPWVKADLFHAIHQLCKVKNLPRATNKLLTIHDINFAHTKTGRKYRKAETRFLYRLKHATHLSFISRFAHDDVKAHFPFDQPSRIIYNGVTAPDVAAATRPRSLPADTGKFLFHLSSLEPYKNSGLLVKMMDSLPGHTLVMAGRCRHSELEEMAAKRPNVIMVGEVDENEKAWLYANCEAFLFPSKAEGFGLPPLEAMLAGKPVFLSTATSLPEVGGDAAFYWNELEPEAMARVVEQGLANPPSEDKLKLQAVQFNWDSAAEEYFRYYIDILNV